MTDLVTNKALYAAPEVTFATDPSADGSGYVSLPCFEISDFKDAKEMLETNFMTGRNFPTRMVVGRDGCAVSFKTPLIGLSTAAGDGGSPPADDWLDILFEHFFTQTAKAGEGVGVGSGAATLVLETDFADLELYDMRLVYELGGTRPRGQWFMVDTDNASATYDVSPDWSAITPTTNAVMYGANVYTYDTGHEGGPTLSMVYREDSVERTMVGGRCTQLVLDAPRNELATLTFTMAFDSYTVESKASLPAALVATSPEPIRPVLNPCYFGAFGTMVNLGHVGDLKVEFNVEAQEKSTQGTATGASLNGRADYILTRVEPVVTINPPRETGQFDYKRDDTPGAFICSLGRGQLVNSQVNSVGFGFRDAQVIEVDNEIDGKIIRAAMQVKATDPGGTDAQSNGSFFQIVRS